MTAAAPARRLPHDLRVVGSDLEDLMFIGALLQFEFAIVSLVHSADPMARAVAEAADVTIVLLNQACSSEATRAAVAKSRAVVAVLDTSVDSKAELEAAGVLVAPVGQPALLQAIVASLAAQVVPQ